MLPSEGASHHVEPVGASSPLLIVHCHLPGAATSNLIHCVERGLDLAPRGRRVALAPWTHGRASGAGLVTDPFESKLFSRRATMRACGRSLVRWQDAQHELREATMVAHLSMAHHHNRTLGQWLELLWGRGRARDKLPTESLQVVRPEDVRDAIRGRGAAPIVLHDPFKGAPRHPGRCTLIPSVLLERAASHFRVARGLEVRRYTSVHLRLFDALSRPRMLQKHWVLPAAHAAAHVCRVLRANARDSSKSSSWLEDAVNSLERPLGIDMDGDGDVGLKGHQHEPYGTFQAVSGFVARLSGRDPADDKPHKAAHIYLSVYRKFRLEHQYVDAFSRALWLHCQRPARVHVLDDAAATAALNSTVTRGGFDTVADTHGNSLSRALLDQLLAAQSSTFVGSHGSSFTKYIQKLRVAANRTMPSDTKLCCASSAFNAAWYPVNFSRMIAADEASCVAENRRHHVKLSRACQRKLPSDVKRRLLLMPAPQERLPTVRASDSCTWNIGNRRV